MLAKTPPEHLTPSLENLAVILRDRSLWPPGFEWDFRLIQTCAIGLAEQIWGEEAAIDVTHSRGFLGYERMFLSKHVEWMWGFIPVGYNRDCVTPEIVARRIDRMLSA